MEEIKCYRVHYKHKFLDTGLTAILYAENYAKAVIAAEKSTQDCFYEVLFVEEVQA